MKPDMAGKRYLERHIEPDMPLPPIITQAWQHVVVIPAYRESPELLRALSLDFHNHQPTLAIVVLNRPASDGDENCNQPLRESICGLPARQGRGTRIRALNDSTDIYLHDLEKDQGASPSAQGVGLARKAGCDIAFYWQQHGCITSRWICSSDADATLPADYFQRLEGLPAKAAAAVYPFAHHSAGEQCIHDANMLYELSLHHYILGLEYASSPYAYHTLGSCIAMTQSAYAKVRGFPKKSGGEDFYLLNKVAKTGDVVRLGGACIGLESRASARVPFGTGPAVAKLVETKDLSTQPLFYHPQCFEALRICLLTFADLPNKDIGQLANLLEANAMPRALAIASTKALKTLGIEKAMAHARQHGKTPAQFARQFHQWFDGFRTMKFIHALRDALLPKLSFQELEDQTLSLWPGQAKPPQTVDQLTKNIHRHWKWIP